MDFVKRPLAVLTGTAVLSFCVFANMGIRVSFFVPPAFVLSSGLFLLFSYHPNFSRKISVALRYLFLILAGLSFALLLLFINFSGKEEKLYAGKEEYTDFVICDTLWENELNLCYKAKVRQVGAKDVNFYVALECGEKYERGSEVSGKVTFSDFETSDTFDEKQYYMSKGMVIKGELEDGRSYGKAEKTLSDFFYGINEKLSDRIENYLEGESGELANAVVLGNKGDLAPEIKRDFSKIGISHLIAISGMHVSYISTAFYFLTKRMRISRKVRSFLCVFIMLFYMGMTGFSASVVRAAILGCFVSLAGIWGICHDGITALGICGAVMLAVCPHFAFDIGMQLSFTAYLGCLAAAKEIERLKLKREENLAESGKKPVVRKVKSGFFSRIWATFRRRLCTSVLVTFLATAFTLPVTWLYYDSASLLAPISNLLFIPLFSIVMYFGIAIMFLSPVPYIGSFLVFCGEKLIDAVLYLSEKFAMIDGLTVSLKYFFSPFIICALFISVVMFVCGKKRASSGGGVGICACVLLYAVCVLAYNGVYADRITFSRVNGNFGDGIVTVSEGDVYFVDFSSGSKSEAIRAMNRAAELHYDEIDVLVLTKYSNGHISLVEKLCESTYLKRVYLPYTEDSEKIMMRNEIEEYLKEKDVEVFSISFAGGRSQLLPFTVTQNEEGDFYLSALGEDESFLYVKGGADNLNGIASRFGKAENLKVLVGNHKDNSDITTVRSIRSAFRGAEIFCVAKTEEKEELTERTEAEILLPDESAVFRIKKS